MNDMQAQITECSIFDFSSDCFDENNSVVKFPFIREKKPCKTGPLCCLSLKKAGSMRFRWNEQNENRKAFFASAAADKEIAAAELIHSKKVYVVSKNEKIAFGSTGDAVITVEKGFAPAVTVADCMPIWIYEPETGVFGVCHSGWKGTGIVEKAIEAAAERFNAKAENFLAVMGPHIHSCCYIVNGERAAYFAENFTPECVSKTDSGSFRLSLAAANLSVLQRCGVKPENILHITDCTCCSKKAWPSGSSSDFPFGSFRRETSSLPETMPLEEKSKHFTVMTAFITNS